MMFAPVNLTTKLSLLENRVEKDQHVAMSLQQGHTPLGLKKRHQTETLGDSGLVLHIPRVL